MTSDDNPKDDENLIPHGKNEYHSFALYAVVEGELYIAAARALALYRGTMNRTRFITKAGEIYDRAESDALVLFERHQRQGGCSSCTPQVEPSAPPDSKK